MTWLQIVMMIIQLLRGLQSSQSAEEFKATSAAQQIGDSAPILDWLWENREELLAFVMRLIELFSRSEDDKVTLMNEIKGE